jgi:hypothetical protein
MECEEQHRYQHRDGASQAELAGLVVRLTGRERWLLDLRLAIWEDRMMHEVQTTSDVVLGLGG